MSHCILIIQWIEITARSMLFSRRVKDKEKLHWFSVNAFSFRLFHFYFSFVFSVDIMCPLWTDNSRQKCGTRTQLNVIYTVCALKRTHLTPANERSTNSTEKTESLKRTDKQTMIWSGEVWWCRKNTLIFIIFNDVIIINS